MNLNYFETEKLNQAVKSLFRSLNIPISEYSDDRPFAPADILASSFKPEQKAHQLIDDVYFIGGVDDNAFAKDSEGISDAELQSVKQKYDGLFIFAVSLNKPNPGRADLAEIARAFNREFPSAPVAVMFKYGKYISLAAVERSQYKQTWREGEKVGKVSILKDINTHKPHAGHLRIIAEFKIKPEVKSFEALYKQWQSAFDLKTLNKEFYKKLTELFYKLVGGEVKIGNKTEKHSVRIKMPDALSDEILKKYTVRLIGRTLFCWFLGHKHSEGKVALIPDSILSSAAVKQAIDAETNYFHSVMEPLFFETLNKKAEDRLPEFRTNDWQYIPYLNGGLFDPHTDGEDRDFYELNSLNKSKYLNTLDIPNDWFEALFNLFDSYYFTIDENTPMEQEVALDPELLGQVFENLLAEINPETGATARKQTGSFYTPREIVDYMVDESLAAYIEGQINDASQSSTTELPTRLRSALKGEAAEFSDFEKTQIIIALDKVKILDPACGSGAFPMGVLHKILVLMRTIDPEAKKWFELKIKNVDASIRKVLQEKFQDDNWDYIRKYGILQDSIYGVDIQPIAVEISKLRSFLTLAIEEKIDDSKPNRGIVPLPNLEFKFVAANTLIALPDYKQELSLFSFDQEMDELREIRSEYFRSASAEKKRLEAKFQSAQNNIARKLLNSGAGKLTSEAITKVANWNPFAHSASDFFEPEWMFGITDGFDIVIGNPPYVSNKGTSDELKVMLTDRFGFADDLYYHFIIQGINLLKHAGVITFITSNTFWTIQTKKNLRKSILDNTLLEIYNTANPFESAMVDTCVLSVMKGKHESKTTFIFKDGSQDLFNPESYQAPINIYHDVVNNVFFKPNKFNMQIFKKYGKTVSTLMEQWWDKISTSKNITKNQRELHVYRQSLKPGDITLLGIVTDGGVGLQTGNNGKFVGALSGTKTAINIQRSRANKLFEAVTAKRISELPNIKTKQDAENYLNSLSEVEIRNLFDTLKEKYGRDIFGQGYLFRIIDKAEIADIDTLTEDEKKKGINKSKPTYVLYDKGDKDGNRWFLESPFYIDWSVENVNTLQTDIKARWQGYDFFFREGFCWSDINTVYLKCRLKGKSVHDVKSMSLFSLVEKLPDWYFACIINSKFISEYVEELINNTQTFQMNDARQLPLIVPTKEQYQEFESIFNRAYPIKKKQFAGAIEAKEADEQLNTIQAELDQKVLELYGLEGE